MSNVKPCCYNCTHCSNDKRKILGFELDCYVCSERHVVQAHSDYQSNRDILDVKIKKKDLWDCACNYFSPRATLNDVGFRKI